VTVKGGGRTMPVPTSCRGKREVRIQWVGQPTQKNTGMCRQNTPGRTPQIKKNRDEKRPVWSGRQVDDRENRRWAKHIRGTKWCPVK